MAINYVSSIKKLELIQNKLLQIQHLVDCFDLRMFQEGQDATIHLEGNEPVENIQPQKDNQVKLLWKEVQSNLPNGYVFKSNLSRHLDFNQSRDWFDIANYDIAVEITNIESYKRRISLVCFIETLHPHISKVSEVVLKGDIEVALKSVYASLDSEIRSFLKLKPGESTVPALGKAFKEGTLCAPNTENNESMRSFLQGVLGFYRSWLVHNPLPESRNSIEASLPLFAIAHETFKLFELCAKQNKEVV